MLDGKAAAGLALTNVPLLVVSVVALAGLLGIMLTPSWIWLGTRWYGYGAVWPVDTSGAGAQPADTGNSAAAGSPVRPAIHRTTAMTATSARTKIKPAGPRRPQESVLGIAGPEIGSKIPGRPPNVCATVASLQF
ncbi:hypothetical protein Aca07nite_56930 [Actinoplanes capillaceus]|uniref:Uncharacterized protein n=1 Tax=Actinoplanes campanulatus TaxID=113559 RepID=A0ABQ3WQA3_9ACTN|nr:hypothetical protein [Actinoplanes capillaceus]GID48418.1 hypothetical protein Aca07nite_56930 [Actinoplanes capillaceus]